MSDNKKTLGKFLAKWNALSRAEKDAIIKQAAKDWVDSEAALKPGDDPAEGIVIKPSSKKKPSTPKHK